MSAEKSLTFIGFINKMGMRMCMYIHSCFCIDMTEVNKLI